jgi:hypothetical protein
LLLLFFFNNKLKSCLYVFNIIIDIKKRFLLFDIVWKKEE